MARGWGRLFEWAVRCASICLVCLMLGEPVDASGQQPAAPPGPVLLDVPYQPQTPELCGGAAAAMVLRYWGERGVDAETFAALVRAEDRGIRADALTADIARRGWATYSFRGTEESVRHHLSRGRPLIVVIAVGRGRFHYVVLLRWHDAVVTLHDPAIAPAQAVPEHEFLRAWSESGSWSLLVLPGGRAARAPAAREATRTDDVPPPAGPAVPESCASAMSRGWAAAEARDLDGAEGGFVEARTRCPEIGASWRELAGLALLRNRPEEAVALARRAVALTPADDHAWRVLATGRFLANDPRGALQAWNEIGEPRVDLVRVNGLRNTRFRVVNDALGVSSGSVLTPETLTRAERRLQVLPAMLATHVRYTPVAGGFAEVDATVLERPRVRAGRMAVAALTTTAVAEREVRWAVAGAAGRGELAAIRWRFRQHRPAVSASVDVPVRTSVIGGVLRLAGGWDVQSYGVGSTSSDVVRESQRAVQVSMTDWASARFRWEAGMGLTRWEGGSVRPSFAGAVETRLARDHIAVLGSARHWLGTRPFGTGEVGVAWRSAVRPPGRRLVHAGVAEHRHAGRPVCGVDRCRHRRRAAAPAACTPAAGRRDRARRGVRQARGAGHGGASSAARVARARAARAGGVRRRGASLGRTAPRRGPGRCGVRGAPPGARRRRPAAGRRARPGGWADGAVGGVAAPLAVLAPVAG